MAHSQFPDIKKFRKWINSIIASIMDGGADRPTPLNAEFEEMLAVLKKQHTVELAKCKESIADLISQNNILLDRVENALLRHSDELLGYDLTK